MTLPRYCKTAGMALGLLALAPACAENPASAGSPPAVVTDAMLGKPTFDERFARLDAGSAQARANTTPRWRTVMGYGGETAFSNRKLSAASVGVDKDFAGVENGRPGNRALGLDPFQILPNQGLAIVARETPPPLLGKVWNAKYYSGQLTTKFSFSQRYGYFEVEARLPAGKGFWPSFWLLPVSGKWPEGGEIDVFEGLGDPRTIYATVHSGKDHRQTQRKVALPFDASSGFHKYGVAWTARTIAWYVDRNKVMETPTPPDVNQPMFMIIGLAVGGPWGGYPDASTRFPGRYEVRRVQAWQLRNN